MSDVMRRAEAWCRRFGVRRPLMNAPMADVAGSAMAAAVSGAGGLGVLSGDFLTPDEIVAEVQALRARTDRPFAVNLRAPQPESDAGLEDLQAALEGLYEELGIDARWSIPDFEAQLEAVLDLHVPVLSVTFGGLREVHAKRCADLTVPVVATATTLREAKVLRSSGVDCVVCQGQEAGGPRLCFEDAPEKAVGLLSLIGPVARATGLPVVASGGIATGTQMAAALVAGASAVMLGTALVRTTQSAAPQAMKDALEFATDTGTVLTECFSGRTSRVLENALLAALKDAGVGAAAYPTALRVMRPIALAARARGRVELMECACGLGASYAREGDIASVLERMTAQCASTLEGTA